MKRNLYEKDKTSMHVEVMFIDTKDMLVESKVQVNSNAETEYMKHKLTQTVETIILKNVLKSVSQNIIPML